MLDDYFAKLEYIDESQRDIDKQLNKQQEKTDWEQLEWLKNNLIASWQDESVKGRVIFCHHPAYVTESTKWNQGQTLAIRNRLRHVFYNTVKELESLPENRSVVDIFISGHAHCMEYLSTQDTGYADSDLNWIICGGSGHSLRRQRKEGSILFQDAQVNSKPIAKSHLFIGRNGRG